MNDCDDADMLVVLERQRARQRAEDEVAVVRARGWAQACGEREAELHAVAVPIRDVRGQLVAVIGVQGPAGRFGPAAMDSAVQYLEEHAAALTAVT